MIGELIDAVLEVILDELFGLLPPVVWGVLGMVGGVVAAVVGVVVFSESVWGGGLLVAVGILLVGRVLVGWYR